MKIEQLSTDDHVWDMRELAVQHHEEFGGSREFDKTAIVETLLWCRNQDERTLANCWLAYTNEGKLAGYLYGQCARSGFSYRHYAIMQMWYVDRQCRGSSAAIRLLQAFEAWAKQLNCEVILIGSEHGEQDEMHKKMTSLVQRTGYSIRGFNAVKYL